MLVSHSGDLLPRPNLLDTLALGNVGVMLFFVLSGFVISEALDVFYKGRILRFAANRAMKILPAYWVVLAISFTVWVVLDHPSLPQLDTKTVIGNIALMGGVLGISNVDVISIAWAVQIEVIFYVLCAILAWVVWRLPKSPVVMGIAGAVVLSLYVFVWWGGHEARFFGVFQFSPYFGFGMVVYLWSTRGSSLGRCVYIALFAVAILHAFVAYNAHNPGVNLVVSTLIFTGLCGIFVVLGQSQRDLAFVWVDRLLGNATYTLYLIHWTVLFALSTMLGAPSITAFVLLYATSFALAFILHWICEAPLMAGRDFVRGQRLYS